MTEQFICRNLDCDYFSEAGATVMNETLGVFSPFEVGIGLARECTRIGKCLGDISLDERAAYLIENREAVLAEEAEILDQLDSEY